MVIGLEKKHHMCEKDYIWNPGVCSCKSGKYSASIIDDLVIMCDEIIDADAEAMTNAEETKTIQNVRFVKSH